MKYFLQLGFTPRLAEHELDTVLHRQRIKYQKTKLSPTHLILSTKAKFNPQALLDTLAGTIRLAALKSTTPPQFLNQTIIKLLRQENNSKINFSLVFLSPSTNHSQLSLSIKKALAKKGLPSRFISTNRLTNPSSLARQALIELIIISCQSHYEIFQTSAISATDFWRLKDQHRLLDAKSGILPLKIARLMVNLSLTQPISPHTTILDPFCGSGTILTEALQQGINTIGIDIQAKAIADSRHNLQWVQSQFHPKAQFQLFQHDSTQITSLKLKTHSISAIVTEGYLGPPVPLSPSQQLESLQQIFQLYSKVLLSAKNLIQPGGRVVFAFPRYRHPQSVKILQDLIDTCENRGYTRKIGPILYSQPKARVKRAITVLTLNH